jgi:hypothetical protein
MNAPEKRAELKQSNLNCTAQIMEFQLKAQEHKLKSFKAISDVIILQQTSLLSESDRYNPRLRSNDTVKNRKATAGLAEFDSDSQMIYLTQNPIVYEDKDILKGEKIVIDRIQNEVRIYKGSALHGNTPSEGAL